MATNAGERLIETLDVMRSEKLNRSAETAIATEVVEANAVDSEDQASDCVAIFKLLCLSRRFSSAASSTNSSSIIFTFHFHMKKLMVQRKNKKVKGRGLL